MHDLPTDWGALCAIVFLLGMRHGFDADHLATIDGLTRLHQRHRPRLARACGALFSLGHGAVVIAIALVVGSLRQQWQPPAWLDAAGAWVSVLFLLMLGVANLQAVLAAPVGQVVPLVGLKGRWLQDRLQAGSAWGVAAVGALFALSFDTIGQSVLFAATASQMGGVGHALALGMLFVAGMLTTDGLNGWWIARLIARADDIAALASRIMGAAVAGVSLLVAGLGLARLVWPAVGGWDPGLLPGAVVVAVMGCSFMVAHLWARLAVHKASAVG
jgi:high-affinity nickel-transport protein